MRLLERSLKHREKKRSDEFVWAEDPEGFMLSVYAFWKCFISLIKLFMLLEM